MGQNLSALDQAMKDQKTSTALHISSSGDLIVGTKENQTVKDMEIRGKLTSGSISTGGITSTGDVTVAGKMAADGVTDETTKDGTYIKQNNTVGKNLGSLDTQVKANADAINEEARKRKYSVTNLENADKQLQTNIDNEAAAREAGDKALDTRITNVKEYLEKQTSDTYVSKDDATVQNGAIVKADKTIGENVTNLDAALAKETAARLGADKAQDKVIEQVNQNMVDGFNTINKNMSDGFTALSQADANELAGRMAADTKLVEATNGGLSLDNDNVLQKTKTKISSTGEVTTSKEAATTLILNKGAANQVKIDSEGITVGTSSTQMDAEGFTAGGHDYDAAGAALMSDGRIKGANGDFTVDTDGNVASGNVTSTGTVKGKTLTDGAGASMSGGTVTGTTLTDGKATISNGNIKTNGGFIQTGGGNVNTQGGEVRTNGGKVATSGGEINTGSGAIKTVGGDILTAGGKLNTSGGNIVAGTGDISGHNITASGVLSGDSLTVANGMTGRSLTLTGGDLDAGAGTIKTTGEVDAGTLNVRGKATVKDLEVKGEFKAETLTSKLDENNYTTINGGNVTSVNSKVSVDDGRTYTSTSNLTEKGRTDTAADGTTTNVSVMTAGGSDSTISSLADKNQKSYITQNLKKILQGIQNGDNATTVDQAETGIKSTATDGKNTASTNLSNKGFNTYATDGTNRTYTLQTAESLTSQIGDDGKVKSVMKADGITNNADGGTITNSAKDLVNKATGDMTNTVGGKLLNDVTGDMENKVGGNLTTTVSGTSTETVTGKKTENYNGGLETTVTGDEKHAITGSQTNTIGGSQTTTVTGDSSLTAENINNTAKNKITNKALDVETEAKSSIVNKVSNDAGSNTSTQLSYETKEEMSANGKTASYLRGAAEEKSQLIDGDKKTTIDTVAGQTNTNITDGTNTSNDLQKADQIASSVTDGTNTTVVNQDAKSLASSATDGTNTTVANQNAKSFSSAATDGANTSVVSQDAKSINSSVTDGTNSTGIRQDAQNIALSANNGTIVASAKNISNTASETLSNSAKNINNTATEKLSNSAADIENKASKSILNQVGENTSWKMTDGTVLESIKGADGQTNTITDTADSTVQNVKNGSNELTSTTSSTNADLTINNGSSAYTKVNTATGNKETVKEGENLASTNLTKDGFNVYAKDENGHNTIINNASGTTQTIQTDDEHLNVTTKTVGSSEEKLTSGSSVIDVLKSFDDNGNPAITSSVTDGTNNSEVKQTASEVAASAKDISNTATDKIISQIGDGSAVKSEMTANGITNTAKGKAITNEAKTLLNKASESITDKVGDNVERTMTTDQIQDKVGKTTVTTIDGKTKLTNEDGTHRTEMDFADVLKDLGVRGNATVDGNTTLGTDRNDTLTVNSTSTFKEKVTMENDLNVKSEVLVNEGDKNQVRINKNGITVGLNSTVVDYEGVYVGGDTFEAAKAGMDKDGKLKAANGNFQVDTKGNVSAVSYTVKDTNIKIDNTGINAGGTKVTGLAPADISHAGSTDAVSGGQLYETNTRVSGLETRMGTVETRVDKLDNKIDKVGANAAAMANLHPLEFDEDSKWNVAAAVGSSGSETASAVGVFYRPNENVMVNASAAMGTGENMFGGGVSLRLGHGGNKAKEAQMKAAAVENKELRAKVDDLTARMDALLSVLNPNMSKDFPDVPENHWAYEAVSRLAGNGIVEGYEDGKYHGERQMTRYEMAEIIYNALSKGAKAEKKLVEEFRPELQAMAAQKKA